MSRYTSATDADREAMLKAIGAGSVDELFAEIPPDVRLDRPLDLPDGLSETECFDHLAELAARNAHADAESCFLGAGMYDHYAPAIVDAITQRSEFLTPYTPYQPEVSQGGLQVMFEFQTAMSELCALPVSNASLYEGPSSVASAAYLAIGATKGRKRLVVSRGVHPHSRQTLVTYARGFGAEVVEVGLDGGLTNAAELAAAVDSDTAAVFVQNPNFLCAVEDLESLAAVAKDAGALAVAAVDPMTLGVLRPPGECGIDIAVGEGQPLGNRLDFGGPSFGFFCATEEHLRRMPGRIAGETTDVDGKRGFVLTLQTREQHIRREKATSNICTAQVLLAVIAGMYAVWHGPEGLTAIARRTHRYAALLGRALGAEGSYFDTILVPVPGRATAVAEAALAQGVEVRVVDADTVCVSTDETTTRAHLDVVVAACGLPAQDWDALDLETPDALPAGLLRTSAFLTHEVFRSHHSETAMLRYLRRLSDKDLALDRTMIPLGSCTMKLNATTEMEPVTWPAFGSLHPFTAVENAQGYRTLITDLERWLCEITGYDACSLQPNAGSQGELAGLLAIREYHLANGQGARDVCLIPASAHGTNAASAVMAGMKVVVVGTTPSGDVDVDDLRAKVTEHAADLAALMITYPSTHGVFEAQVTEICGLVHDAGGQVYVDGANLNALVGLAQPGKFGADVSHLNLHKTFCIPHGGGGPGVGPVAVRAHLAPYLPNHPLNAECGPATGPGPISAAPYGSAGILPISWAYVRMMGGEGLTRATQVAVLSANYVATRLQPHYPVLYTGRGGLVAHECIVDLRPLTKETGVSVDDVAKRLIDYGFHAPTMSFPVAGTLMIEPTESEDLAELDRFCEAMIAIRREIDECPEVLRGAPHTAASVLGELGYDRKLAAFPPGVRPATKYWPPVRRIDGAYGDRNLVCSCPPMEELV